MQSIDWIVFIAFLVYVVYDGVRQRSSKAEDYFLAGRSAPWWMVGFSVMATQASAITMIGTTGKGWEDGMRFVQFYYALPLAMILLAVFAVPAYHRMRVTTAYEYLGKRFDMKTRTLAAVLFLVLRALSLGFVIYAPGVVFSRIFGTPLAPTVMGLGAVAILYTSIGGLKAVMVTDVKQLGIMVLGLLAALTVVILRLPEDVGFSGALRIAGAAGRLEIADWTWNPAEKYTMWSSLIGGLFLFLSYFGTDQSQVQRLLAGRSVRETQRGLLFNAVAKVPFQFVVLGLGALLFVFYIFHDHSVTFKPVDGAAAVALAPVEAAYGEAQDDLRRDARGMLDGSVEPERFRASLVTADSLRSEAMDVLGGDSDTNYVFLDFVLKYLPVGLVGILLAAIVAAALSSMDSELNALGTVVVLDLVRPHKRLTDGEARRLSVAATALMGILATFFALYAGHLGSIIEGVNRVGSLMYGSLLGVFLLVPFKRVGGTGAFVALVVGMAVVAWASQRGVGFLYLNTIGTVVTVGTGLGVSAVIGGGRGPEAERP